MKNKKILILCLMLCFIFSIQAVASADIDLNDTLTTSDSDVLTISNDLSIQATPESNNLLGADEGSFSDLQNDIPATGTVELTRNYTYVDSDSALKDGIPLSGTITIKGNNVVIDASHNARVFNIASGANVTLQGITFINGNSDGNGGAITSEGILNVENCKFINNTAGINGGAIYWAQGAHDGMVTGSEFIGNVANRSGGAVYWFGHDGAIEHSTFTNNKALGNVESVDSYGTLTYGGNGGAIMWVGSDGTVNDCTFTDNSAVNHGGAVYLQGSSEGICNNTRFDGCTFISNEAGVNGGAIDWYRGARNGIINNSVFKDNVANRSGGAIFWSGIGGIISLSNFTDNTAKGIKEAEDSFGDMTYGGYGGAVIWTGSDGIIDGCRFDGNKAMFNTATKSGGRGGAVYLQGSVIEGVLTNCSNTTFTNSIFTNNYAGMNGGAIAFDVGSYNCTIQSSEFNNNFAEGDGGAVNIAKNSHIFTVADSIFNNDSTGDDGGAINWEGYDGIIKNITCYNCTGLAHIDPSDNTWSTSKGGTICLTGDNITVTESKFILGKVFHNRGKLYETDGGALFVTGENTIISHSEFIDCSSPNQAGAIKVIGNGTVIDNCTFLRCTVPEDGGAIYVEGLDCKVYNSTFTDNTAGDDGGAILWEGARGLIYNSTFTNNKALGLDGAHASGGAINLVGDYTVVEKSKFDKNTAIVDGGAIYASGDYINITDSTFSNSNVTHTKENNYAHGGGAIYIKGHDTNIINSTFNQTNARVGGVIYVQGYDASIINSTITNSYAVTGGAVYIDGQNASVINSSFSGTNAKTTSSFVADNKGGAIYILGNYATIEGSNFTDASAYQGGILYLQGQYCNVINSSLDHGYSYHDGGAYYSTGTDSNVTGSNFTNNVARSDGGALFWLGSKYNYVIGCIFDNNTAYANPGHDTRGGGAIYFSQNGQYCGIKDSKFFNNSVQSSTKADGGAILWDKSSHIFIDGCLFDGNYVTSSDYLNPSTWVQGGVMYARPADNLTISNSVFQNCWSKKEAGALYLQNGGTIGIHLINNTFINNTAYGNKITNNNDLGGGAILIKSGTIISLINSSFKNNTANYGGGICINSVNDLTITNATFDGDKATFGGQDCGQGGGIWTRVKFAVNNITFANCEATNRGGGLYISNSADMSYTNLTFINNSAILGGGFYWSRSSVTIDGMSFINNSADLGGAIYIPTGGSGPQTPTSVINSNFSGNSANNGGAIYINAGNIKISNNNFTYNTAVNGGAIYTPYSTSANVDIAYSDFIGNNASNGGAIYSGAKGIEDWNIHDCNFTNNSATASGGAIYVANVQFINNCMFDANTADGDGGAVYVPEDVTGVKIQDSTFTNSHARNGGAVYYGGTTNVNSGLKIINDTFIKNTAVYNGAAVLYVTNNGINNYRDYNNFDGIGIPVDGGRTTVKTNDTNVEIITTSLFEDNIDYKLLLRVISDRETPFIAVYLDNPRDWRTNKLRFVVNLTNATTHELISTVIVNASNYDTHYRDGMLYVAFSNLIINQTYNITVSFEDLAHTYKENSTIARAHGEVMGEFKLLQKLIDDALERGDSELVLNRTFTFTPEIMGITENMDDRCINLTHIDRPFTIRGEGWLIDAAGYSRIFYITSPNVTIENVVLVGGNASGKYGDPMYHDGDIGGAIYWAGANGTLKGSHVENNNANLGGGIYFNASAPNCKIIGTTFENNKAVTNGGAIDCNASKMELYNNTFRENFAYIGGALCREINSTNGRGVNNTFANNTAEYAGAGIAWINATHISIDEYNFYNNHAGYSGGALYVGEGSLNCEILNCAFVDNAVDNNSDGHGGAIEWYSEKGTVYNSVFTNNHAYDGGAIYVGEGSGHINITKSTFTENVALTTGGAISIVASAVTINESNFYDNIAKDGGAVYVGGKGTDNYVYSSVFEGNKAIGDENAMNGIGGAIDWVASSGTIVNSRFTENCADYGGGVYFGDKSNKSNITNCIFERNQAKYNGGAVDCNASMMYIEGTLFDGNIAQFGAALCRETNAKTGAGINNVFKNNHAIVAGAALGWMGSFGITITNYTFINNSADVAGGAIYVSPDSHNCSVNDCRFEDNYITNKTAGWAGGEGFTWTAWDGTQMTYRTDRTDVPSKATTADMFPTETVFYYNSTEQLDAALGTGGAMSIFGANATVKNSNFIGNRARLGGGVYIGASSGNADIDYTIWRNNVAEECGGALMIYASAVHVDDSQFYDNIAVNGSALYVGGEGTENKVHRTIFEGNNATGYGGAIYWVAYVGEIHNSEFTKNAAEYGGGIYFNGRSANTNLINITFKSNSAVKNGGAIDCNASNIGIYNITFEENNAGEYGGALCREINATGGHGLNNTFLRNHAGISGAGLAWMGVKDIHIIDYHFIDNTAERSGGAIFVDVGSDNDIIENCTFTGNHLTNMTEGHNGGAIDCRGKNLTIDYVDFTNNGAYTGGAIYMSSDSKNIRIFDSNFTKNYAVGDGGALGLKSEALNINNTIFKSNTAGHNGGAVYAGGNGTDNSIHYSVFEDNIAGDHGGAINWLASAGTFEYLNFTRNNAAYGGGIYLNGVSTNSTLNYIIFRENSATKNGGAIDCNATMMGLTNSQFISNRAGEYGAALAREENATGGYGRNNTFILNHADISGAALAWLGVDGVTINNYTFLNNTAFSSGGAIYVRADSTNCTVYNSHFEDNYVIDVKNGQGGAIDWGGPNGLIENVTFIDSFAVNGGTIYAGQNSTNLTIFNTSFIGSRALGDGGAIALYGDNAKITYSNFTYALALTRGGGISGHNANNATIDHCLFDYGIGAGYVDSTLKAYGEGGAIHWEDSEGLNVSNSQFSNIRSNSNGGVISAINTNASNLYNLTFNQSYSSLNGGSISWINSTGLTFDLLKVEDSEAHTDGGAIYLMGINDTTIKNSVFNNTISPRGNGGSIYINGNATLRNNTFDGYEAYKDNGGSLFLENGNITVADSSFNGRDAIWINHDATAYLNNNKITGPEPNRDLYYLIDGYNELISYAVWNDGDLHLLGDSNYDYIIINNGTIWTPTTTKLMDNKTYNVTWNENFTFWAHIYDDSIYQNTIISVDSLNTTNDVYHDVDHSFILPYNCLTLNCTYQGSFLLTPFDNNLKQNTIYQGTLNVKMPVDLELIFTNIDDYSVGVWAKLTPQARSNFTIEGQTVTIKVGDNEYQVNVTVNEQIIGPFTTWTVGNASKFLDRIDAGEYTATASYAGDAVHLAVENVTKTFYIQLHDIWISLNITDIFYGQTIALNVTSNATRTKEGYVTIWINGKEVFNYVKLDENGSSLLYLTYDQYKDIIVKPGTQSGSIAFTNGSYYNSQLNFTSFEVKKYHTNITVNVSSPIDVGSPLIVNVTVNETATGVVKLTIDGKGYIEEIHNGTATFEIYGLAAGNYTNKTVEYAGNDWFDGNSTNITFVVVPKSDYVIEVLADNITYGNNATIRVIVPTDATGNVTIYVDGNIVENVTVVNGIAILNVVKPVGGEHVVNVTYNGDSAYSSKDKNGTKFMVYPNNTWDMTIIGDYKPYGENSTFTFRNIPIDILGNNLTVKIDNVSYVVPINNGVATLTLNNLSAGQHSASVTYDGDANYINKTKKFFPDIPKATPTVTLVQNGTDMIAVVTGNVTGNVTFLVNEVEYTVDLTSGRNATLVGKLKIGDNYVYATYNGDKNYTQANAMGVFNVAKLNTTITVTPTNITFGQDEIITVSVDANATGFIAVNIDGKIYVEYINNEGVATFNITGLAAKNYTDVRVTYYPTTTDFNANVTATSFRVDLTTDYKFHVIAEDIEYGHNATVRVIMDPSANGNVTIYVDGEPVGTVNVTNGEAVLSNISGLAGGQHVVNATYNGDLKFAPKDNSTRFMVNPNTSWKVNITEVDYRPYGEYSTINITNIPSDFTGDNLTIIIDDIEYVVPIVDGKATLRLNNLSAGPHMATVNYGGDANYSAISQVFRPNIPQATPTITLTEVDGDVVATVSGNTTGNVTFYVNGAEYTINLTSGRNATLTKDHLSIGNNAVVAIYNGDKNYTSARTVGNFTGDKLPSTVNVTVNNTVYGNTVEIVVQAGENQTGFVEILVNGKTYVEELDQGMAKFYIDGLNAKDNYTVNVTYYENEKYHLSVNSTVFNVTKADMTATVVGQNVTVEQNPSFIIDDVTSDFKGNVTIVVNDHVYYNGTVKSYIEIARILQAANYTANVTFYGDNNYNDKSYLVNFTVSRVDPTINVTIDDVTYPANASAVVSVSNNANGTIEIYLGETLIGNGTVVNGQATTINLIRLSAGSKEVTVKFITSDEYNNNATAAAEFNVIKGNTTVTIVRNGTDVIAIVTPGVTGNVTFYINGEEYKNVTVNGNATIVGKLHIGNNTVSVIYRGNENYTGNDSSAVFEIVKITTGLTVDATPEVIVGKNTTITVTMTNVTSGKVLIEVNGYNYTVDIGSNGIATLVVGLPVGNYTAHAYYLGDSEHEPSDNVSSIFEVVNKTAPSVIISDVHDIELDTNLTFTVTTNSNATLVVKVNGVVVEAGADGKYHFNGTVVGDYRITAEVAENDYYYAASNSTMFNVIKHNSTVNVTATATVVGEDAIINVTIPTGATGYVIVNVDGTKYAVNTTDGKGSIVLEGLGNATHKVNVTYVGDDNYLPSENSTSFGIERANTTIAITVESIDYGQKANITVTVMDDATGYITIKINETQSITLPVVNGKANWIVDNLAADNYTVYANYSGDAKYNSNKTNKSFEVRRIAPEITIESVEVDSATNATVIVHITPGATGNINITVNDKNYSGPIDEDGVARITVDVLPVGEYDIEANYAGDKNYTNASAKLVKGLNVTKVEDYVMNVTAIDVKVGENTTITVNVPKDATGNVTIWVNGTTAINTTIVNGVATFNITKDIAGKYTVNATLSDPKYANKTVETVYYVTRNDTPMNISVLNDTLIYVGDVVKVVVSVPGDATGNVTIEIDGKSYTNETVSGNATFYITDLIHGDKSVYASYEGNNKYVYNSTTANFTVYKRDSFVKVNVTNSTVGSGAVINVTVPKNATGQVIVNVNGTEYSVNVTDGTGSITVYNLGSGTYDVNVTYTGDEQYLSSSNSTRLAMDKLQPAFTVNGTDIIVGDTELIKFETSENITGLVNVEINNVNYTAFISEGKGNLTVYGLAAGKYNVTVYFKGNDKYLNASARNNFTVTQNSTSIDVSVMNITYTENETVIVYVDAIGNVTLTIDSIGYNNTVDLVDGKAVFVIADLAAGNYTVNATYNGNVNLTSASKEANFTVFKAIPEVDVTVTNITYYDVENITVVVNTGGNVTIKVNGTGVAENAALTDGKVVISVENLKSGTYPVEVIYSGNENYTDATVSTFFVVDKGATTVDVQVADIAVNGTEVINVTISNVNATGIVVINVDGVNYTRPIANGQANLTLDKLANGTHSVVVIYEGDANLTGSWISKTFNVSKLTSQLTINVTNIRVNETETIKVNVTEGATGTVVISVDGIKYHVEIEDGFATLVLGNLTAGSHAVHTEYLGDANYTGSEGDASFNVSKLPSTVVVKVDNITVGDVAVLNITVITNATGNVTIKIGDEFEQTVGVIDGVITVTVPNLTIGDKIVNVTYNGDAKFLNSTNSTTFTVTQDAAGVVIVAQNITYGDNETVTVYVDATGNVTLTIDAINYNETVDIVDGKAVFVIADLAAGNYTVNATYNGNVNLTRSSSKANFTVSKATPAINVTVTNITYYDVERISVDVGTGGNVTIKVNGTVVVENAALTDGKFEISVENLKAGTYPVEVIYSGNENYTDATVSTFFVVDKAATTVDVEVSDIAVDGKEIINVTINNVNATGNVIINVDGVNYTRPITNGQANLTLDKLANGTHSVVVIYEGDANLTGSWISKTFNVSKLSSQLTINVTDTTTDGVETIKVNVTEGATGTVVITVDGINHHVEIENGFATLVLGNLTAGLHAVHAEYLGDANYTGSEGDASFNVSKLSSTITVEVDNITVGDVAVLNITVITNATGNVTIKIGDEFEQTVGIVDGVISVAVPNLTVGNKTVEVTYNGDGKFLPSNATANFTVGKASADIILLVENITYGEVETVTAYANAKGNVTFEMGGEVIATVNITDGKAVWAIPYLNAGNYTIKATYNGNDDADSTTATANFTVFKADPVITVEVKDIIYGDVEHIIVHSNASGNVTIKVNGQEVTIVLLEGEGGHAVLRAARWDIPEYDGKATLDVYNLAVGNYPVEVTYNGNENYNPLTVNTDFDVIKDSTSVSVEVEPTMKVNESQVINIKLNNTNATGNVTINIDGVNYTSTINNGQANFTVDKLKAGNHTVVVVYDGDGNFTGNWTSANIEVVKLESDINVTISNSTVGGKQTITVDVPQNATGQVLIDINDQHYYANISDGKAVLELDTLPAGEYSVTATYLGDENYTSSSKSDEFNVTKNNSTVTVTPQNITFGDNEVITFTVPEDATGNITVVVNNETYTVPVSGGQGNLTVPGLHAGEYTINATYNGDDKYAPSQTNATFKVDKKDVELDVIDQGNRTVVVTVSDNATGNVTIKVGDEIYNATIENGKAVVTLTNATPGENDIEVTYSGDANHNNKTVNVVINAPKYDAPINASADPINVGDTAVIVVELPENATGNVTIEIDGVTYTTNNITNGKATFEIENLTHGNKTVSVKYSGDDNYLVNSTTTTIEVSKVTPDIEFNVTVEGDDVIIDVTAPADVTKPVLVDIGGTGYYVNITNGKGQLIIPRLANGNYNVTARYPGDEKYTPAETNQTLQISEVPSNITVKSDNITVGDKAVIEISVPKDATGNVTVTVDGKDYNVTVSEGKGILVVPDLKVGNYTVTVKYPGDSKYGSSENSTTFEVGKITPEISVVDNGNGTVTVILPKNATCNVTVTVDGQNYTVDVVDGKAVVELTNATPGKHDITATYSGDGNYTDASTSGSVAMPKYSTPIDVNVSNIRVGDKEVIVVSLPENAAGNVTIEIDGVTYTTNNITNGKATFEIGNLSRGNKTVSVRYSGDDNYLSNSTTANFTVSQWPSSVTVSVDSIDVGENATVTVHVPEDATGQVLIDIGGVGYYVNVTDGVGSIEIPYLPEGTYEINATYLGDDKYLPSSNKTTFDVSKVDSFVIPSASDIGVGGNEVITFTVPEDATGNITVVVNGETYTVPVSGGKGTLVISGLPRGNYTVQATYNGDDKYGSSSNSTTFKVSKIDSKMEITDLGNGTVIVNLPDNATGNVTIKVGNETYVANVTNGTAKIDLDRTPPGTYDITAIYSGDGTYNNQTAESSVTIPKVKYPISVSVKDIKVGDDEVVTVTLPKDATGKVTFEIDGRKYTADVKDGKATVHIPNLAAGSKTIAVSYSGDDKYLEDTATAKFKVSKRDSTITVKSKNINVGTDEVIVVNVPKDATGRVLVNINGVGYYANVIDGVAKVIIPELPSGKYTAKVTYEGNAEYSQSKTVTTTFTVTKVKTPISADGDNIDQGQQATVIVKVPDDATGTVTIGVNGKTYTHDVENGKAVFEISGLKKGDYNVDASYSGDKKYEANDTITDVIVNFHENGNNNPADYGGEHHSSQGGVSLADHPTGNPILALLLILVVLASTQIRRFKK